VLVLGDEPLIAAAEETGKPIGQVGLRIGKSAVFYRCATPAASAVAERAWWGLS
jgi:hypothetical protein